jgi:sirohydrochlorin cobaltochelatase
MPSQRALVLFGHGARDPRWREPFDRLHAMLQAAAPTTAVRLCFLELMTPDLPTTIAELAADNVQHVTVIPVFFGQGGHLRRDLPALLDACRERHPGVTLHAAPAVGENEHVLRAIVGFCLEQGKP